jgi:hypothetical protein
MARTETLGFDNGVGRPANEDRLQRAVGLGLAALALKLDAQVEIINSPNGRRLRYPCHIRFRTAQRAKIWCGTERR